MAERRMFAKSVISSARFLRMPSTSRLLYYDLGMSADDDGVVEAFTVMRTTGATEDDLRVLVSKGFVVVLNEDLVTYITDWTRNNLIKKDRYHPSIYASLLVQLPAGSAGVPCGFPVGSNTEPEVRLGETSTDKVRLGEENVKADKPPHTRFSPPSVEEVKAYCADRKNSVDPQYFIDYYTARGWRLNNGPMKDWKAAVRTWERNEKNKMVDTRNEVKRPEDYTGGNFLDELFGSG